MAYQKLPEWRLWLRSLMPSAGSLSGSFVLVVVIMGFHLLLLSNDPNLLIPHLSGRQADDQLMRIYADVVQRPLNDVFASNTLGVLSSAILWGVVGLVVYVVFDLLVSAIRGWRSSDKEINVPLKNQVIRHPLHRQFMVRFCWRLMIGLVLLLFTIGIQSVIPTLFKQDIQLLQASSPVDMLQSGGLVLMGWILILHVYTVLLRLLLLRTRVFGEVIY